MAGEGANVVIAYDGSEHAEYALECESCDTDSDTTSTSDRLVLEAKLFSVQSRLTRSVDAR